MDTYRKSKRSSERAKNAPPLEPLDETQLNAVMRNVFAWMTVGMGITAMAASALVVSPIYPDFAGIVIIIIAHVAIAFTLDRKLRRFTPTLAGAFFIFYAALTGFTLSTFFAGWFYPAASGALVSASSSTGGLFGLMTLIGWRTGLDFSRARSYVLMALLGLLIAFLANKLLAGVAFDYVFSFFSVLLFSGLAAGHLERVAALATDPNLQTKPTDSLEFSVLAALQLYLSAGITFALALTSGSVTRSRGIHNYRHLPHHQQSHYSGFGSGGVGGSSGGFGGEAGSAGGGGGGSFTP